MVFDFTVHLTRHDSIISLAHSILESLFVTQWLKMSDKQDRYIAGILKT